ncbi:hypothetical protein AB835_03365 [Candidatus Endobugula sertula]|uniref:Endonuclease/exonuclease/phosphatase domain-containing protein n=1 Tax=Candidatus Endobugula sertula TaxID=62101 RepID=A0A1D2QSF6_9GAMM|nr:hypothetical protein AB835_03365 [Candidatus Endobugula sertula]
MTYNVHSCIGMDGQLSPQRIARVIGEHQPDIVALQELDVGRDRTNGVDQAHIIARLLNMNFHFYPAIHVEEEQYGDAILTQLPTRLIKKEHLPSLDMRKKTLEPRGALWVEVDYQATTIHVINTHLSLSAIERRLQIDALLSCQWIRHPVCQSALIVCGDFNATPWQYAYHQLDKYLNDVQKMASNHSPQNTFSSRYPSLRIDHIFVDKTTKISVVYIPKNSLSRVASDHLPLIVDLIVD